MNLSKNFNKAKLLSPLKAFYFFVVLLEMIAELKKDWLLTVMTKPLIIPALLLIYWCSSKKINYVFVLSLVTIWISDMFLISNVINIITIGSVFFLTYRILISYLVFKKIKFSGYLPMIIGSLPFLFMYLFIAAFAHEKFGQSFWLFMFQGLLMVFFGGMCFGNYIIKSSRSSTFLLTSTLLFTAAQLLLVIELYYPLQTIFQTLIMFCFALGQYLLYKFILLEESRNRRHKKSRRENS